MSFENLKKQLMEDLSRVAESILFEVNDSLTRKSFKCTVEDYLQNKRANREIADFAVVCDETNNPLELIDRSEFVADVYVKKSFGDFDKSLHLNLLISQSKIHLTCA